jgi:hypothetical protein
MPDPARTAEFDMLMARAGVAVDPERRDGLLAAYHDLRAAVALLYGRGVGEAEPAVVFRLDPLGGI